MKIPKVIGKKRIRDARICKLWADDLLSIEELSRKLNLTVRRIQQILYVNKDFVKSNQDWEKTKRKRWLRKQIHKAGNSRKDPADLVNQLRIEEEGDKPDTKIEVNMNFTLIEKIHAARKERDLIGITQE